MKSRPPGGLFIFGQDTGQPFEAVSPAVPDICPYRAFSCIPVIKLLIFALL
jgi:hypothetical protein